MFTATLEDDFEQIFYLSLLSLSLSRAFLSSCIFNLAGSLQSAEKLAESHIPGRKL
jgi:hypothetical protein